MLPLLLLLACDTDPVVDSSPPLERGEVPESEALSPVLKRLTRAQYDNVITEVFGDGIVLPASLEPDESVSGLIAIGAGLTTISPHGVEKYEDAAYSIAEQADAELRASLVPCTPTDTVDSDCASAALEPLARLLWRRPLSADELDTVVGLADLAASTLGDFHHGLEFGIAALLQSPHFLFRVELGQDDPDHPGARRYSDYELASRLSFFLWNSLPDEELLTAADAGELTTEAGLVVQVDRMLADPRARQGLRNFFDEMLLLYELEDLDKDPEAFPHWSNVVPASAREETLAGLEYLVFEEDGDYRDILTTQRTFLDRKLASIYEVAAPEREGFGETTLPSEGGRRGLLGQVSILAHQAHPVSSSVTKRGVFIREVLLCQEIPPPPADVDTSIPEASDDAPTMRERVARHLEDPSCAGCHSITNPIGLGLENFDGIGRWRNTENGYTIDPSGELEERPFSDAWDLAGVLREHEDFADCLSETLLQYAQGAGLESGQSELSEWHQLGFEIAGFRMQALMRDIALGPAFRTVGEVQ